MTKFMRGLISGIGALLLVSTVTVMETPVAHAGPQLNIVGTGGGPLLRNERMQASSILRLADAVIMIDIGEGALHRANGAGIAVTDIDFLLLAHLHTDHVADIWSLMLHRWATQAPEPLEIIGPPGTDRMLAGLAAAGAPVATASAALGRDLPDVSAAFRVMELRVNEAETIALPHLSAFRLRAVRNSHLDADRGETEMEPLSISYSIDHPARSFLFTGDTGPSSQVEQLGKGVDVMVSEIVDVGRAIDDARKVLNLSEEGLARLRMRMSSGHLTPAELGRMAGQIAPGLLVVSHLAPGTDAPSDGADAKMASAIASGFKGKIVVARDLMRF